MSDKGDDAMQTSSTKSLSGKDDSATQGFDTIKPSEEAGQYDVMGTLCQCSNVANSSSAGTSSFHTIQKDQPLDQAGRHDVKGNRYQNFSVANVSRLGTPGLSDGKPLIGKHMNSFWIVRHAVFASSDDAQQAVHVVYDWDSTDFVLKRLRKEVETRGGLRLVLRNTLSDKQRDIVDRLERCRQTLVVRTTDIGRFESVMRSAVEEARHADRQMVFIATGGRTPDLYLCQHETDTMMMFPVDQPNREKDFWDTLSILCGLSDGKPMIDKHRHIMNSFGIVHHAVFASSDDVQQVVHVVYDMDSTDFVLKRLRKEVETRGGLRLVLPNTGTSVLSDEQRDILDRFERCRQTLVVRTTDIIRFESVMRSAVEEARRSDRQMVFIATGGGTPDLYLYRHETDTMIMFPVNQPNRENDFWDTLSIFCGLSGAQLSGCKHRSLVNSFGPVRHALLKSSHDPQHPIRLIHVMYDADSTIFVHGRLMQELEVRAGMELVLPDTGNSTASCVHRAEFLRMLTCCQGVMVVLEGFAGTQIAKTVEQNLLNVELRNPDIKMLFIENGRSICLKSEWWPQWQNPRKNRCELLRSSFDRFGVDSEEFWNKAIDFIESTTPSCSVTLEERNSTSPVPSSSVESTSQDIECTPVQIPCAASSAHSEPEDDYSVTDASAVYGASRCSSANAAEEENNSQKLPASSRISASGTKSLKLHIPMSEPETEPEKDIPSLSRLSRRSESDSDLLSLLPSRPRSLSLNNIGTTDMLHENLNLSKTGEASFDSDILNGQKLSSSAVALSEKEDPPPPIVSRRWQSVFTSSSAGGTFHKSDSDVVLDIPAHALDGDASVDIRTAVCTDVDLVQQILKLPDDEYVCSLLVEYWAGHDFRFKKPVSIILPHFLPPDPDPHLVRVYRVARRPDGQLTVTRLKLDERRESETNPDEFVSGLDLEGSRLGQEVNKATHQERASPDREIPWDETGSFCLSTDNNVLVVTDHFSAYVCTCGQQQNDPVLIAMACGFQRREVNGKCSAQVTLYVWDKRLEIADFQQDFGINTSQKIDKMSFRLLDCQDEVHQLRQSRLHVRLELTGQDKDVWQFCLRSNGRPSTPAEQKCSLDVIFGCDNIECSTGRRKRACPGRFDWQLENKPQQTPTPGASLQHVLDFMYVSGKQQAVWKDEDVTKSWPLQIPNEPTTERHTDSMSSPSLAPKGTGSLSHWRTQPQSDHASPCKMGQSIGILSPETKEATASDATSQPTAPLQSASSPECTTVKRRESSDPDGVNSSCVLPTDENGFDETPTENPSTNQASAPVRDLVRLQDIPRPVLDVVSNALSFATNTGVDTQFERPNGGNLTLHMNITVNNNNSQNDTRFEVGSVEGISNFGSNDVNVKSGRRSEHNGLTNFGHLPVGGNYMGDALQNPNGNEADTPEPEGGCRPFST